MGCERIFKVAEEVFGYSQIISSVGVEVEDSIRIIMKHLHKKETKI